MLRLEGKDFLPLCFQLVQPYLAAGSLLRLLYADQLLVVLLAALRLGRRRRAGQIQHGDQHQQRPHFSAASTARFAITVIRCARYSGEAWRSLFSPSGLTLMPA